MSYEITGNWCAGAFPSSGLIVREPEILADQTQTFSQTLRLPAGKYLFSFIYDSRADRYPGKAMGRKDIAEVTKFPFEGFFADESMIPVEFSRDPREEYLYRADVLIDHPSRSQEGLLVSDIELSLSLSSTRPVRTFIDSPQGCLDASQIKTASVYYGIAPEGEGEMIFARSIPFHLSKHQSIFTAPGFLKDNLPNGRDSAPIRPFNTESAYGMNLEGGSIRAHTLHFLGMIHNIDYAHGAWYNTRHDEGYSHLAGDIAGNIQIVWEDDSATDIPLIFGVNLWYCAPWDIIWNYQLNPYSPGGPANNFDDKLFCGVDSYRRVLGDSIALSDGVRNMGAFTWNSRFIFSLDVRGRSIRSIRCAKNPSMYDFPIISAITAEVPAPPADPTQLRYGDFAVLPDFAVKSSCLVPISVSYFEKRGYIEPLTNLMRLLYTFTSEKAILDSPEIPRDYFGPSYEFRGGHLAHLLATYLYYNGPECAAHIADTGTGCSSSTAKWALSHYTFGTGVWIERKAMYDGLPDFLRRYREKTPGQFPGGKNAWTRGIGELVREAVCFGYDKYVDRYLDWLDECLFDQANPPHWNRIAGVKDFHLSRKVGDVIETGNRENDGHGICMWGRYMAWHKSGRPAQLSDLRKRATRAAAEWIAWQLDTDTIYPGVRKDVLFTDSECAHNTYDIYSSYNCLHGLRLTIRQLQALGDPDRKYIENLMVLEQRLARGILEHLTEDSAYGKIWLTEYKTDWQDHAHKLVHLQIATEGITFTPLEDYAKADGYDAAFLKIDLNSYHYLINRPCTIDKPTDDTLARIEEAHNLALREKLGIKAYSEQELAERNRYHYLRMYGYGQGMMTQAALLLDQMEDAGRLAEMLVTYCYLPKFGRYISPEGIILHKSHQYYLPVNGYMGQDSHLADSAKAIRIMIGADDNNPACLRLVPRFPADVEEISIRDFPIVTSSGKSALSYTYTRTSSEHCMRYSVTGQIDETHIRMGPFQKDPEILHATCNGDEISWRKIESGDSFWVWVKTQSSQDSENILRLFF